MVSKRWWTIEKIGPLNGVRVSCFLKGGVSISFPQIINEFPAWSDREKREFLGAYSLKPELTEEDERIIEFLMDSRDTSIWKRLAILSTRHPDKERVLDFLVGGLRTCPGSKANFLVALGLLNDPRAVQPLREVYAELKRALADDASPEAGLARFNDILCCSKSLHMLTGDSEYKRQMDDLLHHRSERVRKLAHFVSTRDLRE